MAAWLAVYIQVLTVLENAFLLHNGSIFSLSQRSKLGQGRHSGLAGRHSTTAGKEVHFSDLEVQME